MQLLAVFLLAFAVFVCARDEIDYTIFDLVDELKRENNNEPLSFYQVLGVEREATLDEITKAHRKLTIAMQYKRLFTKKKPRQKSWWSGTASLYSTRTDCKHSQRFRASQSIRSLSGQRGACVERKRLLLPTASPWTSTSCNRASVILYCCWISVALGQLVADEGTYWSSQASCTHRNSRATTGARSDSGKDSGVCIALEIITIWIYQRLLTTDRINCVVECVPPRSGVRTFVKVWRTADSMRCAWLDSPRWRSIITELRSIAVGLALLVPSISFPTWRHPYWLDITAYRLK